MGDENNGEITCCVRWTPILVLVLSYVTAALMYYLSMKCYTTIDPENINHKAYDVLSVLLSIPMWRSILITMWEPNLLTGLWFLVLAGFILLLQNACCACRTGTGKLRLSVILVEFRLIDVNF